MNIKTIHRKLKLFIFILSCSINSLLCLPAPQSPGQLPPPPSAQEIEEIMKSPEFTKMMEELEDIFKDMDEKEKSEPAKPKKKIEPKPRPTIKPRIPSEPKTAEQNFLESAKPTAEKSKETFNVSADGKLIKKLSTEKLEAFDYFIDRFTRSLGNIENKINSFDMGIAFKERMEKQGFNKTINEIDIAINQIRSKKLYKKIFFLPINTELRKEIINSLKISEKLEKDLEEKNPQEYERNVVDFLQKIASTEKKAKQTKKKKYLTIENPQQNKIENFFNINLKNINKKINIVSRCTQAKEEIEKKKERREKLTKDALQKQKLAAKRRTSSYRQPYSSGQGWSGYNGRKKSTYSGPRSWRSNYSRGYTPRRYRSTRRRTPSKTSLPETKKTSEGSGKLPEKFTEKINLIKNLSKENAKLLNEVTKKYDKKNEQKSFKQIYKSKLLTEIQNNFNKLKEAKASLSEVQKKQVVDEKLNNAIINFMPLGVRLAADPTKNPQQESVQIIMETQPEAMKAETKKYEDEIVKQLEGKANLLVSPNTSIQDIESVFRNLKILNNLPVENRERIEKINKSFKEQDMKKTRDETEVEKREKLNQNFREFFKSVE